MYAPCLLNLLDTPAVQCEPASKAHPARARYPQFGAARNVQHYLLQQTLAPHPPWEVVGGRSRGGFPTGGYRCGWTAVGITWRVTGGVSERGTRRRRRTRGRHGADTGRRNTGKARRRRVRASSARKLNKITADQTGETSGRRTRTTLRPRGITTAGPDRGDGHGAEAGARTLVFSLSTAARHRDGGRGRRARGSSAITAGRTDGTIARRRGRR